MMDSAFAKMGFSTYTPSSIACVIKDVPIFDTRPPCAHRPMHPS